MNLCMIDTQSKDQGTNIVPLPWWDSLIEIEGSFQVPGVMTFIKQKYLWYAMFKIARKEKNH